MDRKHILISCIVLLTLFFQFQSYSQESEDNLNRAKNSIGLDIQFLSINMDLKNIGSSLLYRKHSSIDEEQKKRALRFQFRANVFHPFQNLDSIEANIIQGNSRYSNQKSYNTSFLIGKEFQRHFNKLALYYGADIGIEYYREQSLGTTLYRLVDNEFIRYSSSFNFSEETRIPIYIFIGAEFFLLPQLSLSIEANLNLGFSWYNYQLAEYYFDDQRFEQSDWYNDKEINFYTDFLRFINLNYYF